MPGNAVCENSRLFCACHEPSDALDSSTHLQDTVVSTPFSVIVQDIQQASEYCGGRRHLVGRGYAAAA